MMILETDRLLLRQFHIDDALNLYRLNLNPKVTQYTGNVAFKDIEEARQFLEKYPDYTAVGYGRWAVINKQDRTFLGWCGLKYLQDIDETDIGYRFFEHHWNQGYATESAKACIQYGFQNIGLNTIIGRAMIKNPASIKVFEKCGLTFEREFDFDVDNKGVIYRIHHMDVDIVSQ